VVTAAKEKLNQEIEKKEQQAAGEKYDAAMDAAAGRSSQTANKSGGRSSASQFFTKPRTSSGKSVAYYAAANRANSSFTKAEHPNDRPTRAPRRKQTTGNRE
jgi:hypothetical protein